MIKTVSAGGALTRYKANCHTSWIETHNDIVGSYRSYSYGSTESRKAITKGDHVHATEYWANFEDIDRPSGQIVGDELFSTSYPLCVGKTKGIITSDATSFSGIMRGWDLLIPDVSTNTRDMVYSMSILKAQAKLRDQLTSLPLLFSERKATLKTVKRYSVDILKRMRRLQLKDVARWKRTLARKPSPARLKKLASNIADRHLEFVFGILPIINDIETLVADFDELTVLVRTGRGRHASGLEADVTRRLPAYFQYDRRELTNSLFSARTSLRCDVSSQVLNDASLLGFNPLYTWYDLTPLSFVLGWFSNFNLWLKSLDPIIGLTYVTGSTTTRSQKNLFVDCTLTGQNPGKYNVSSKSLPRVSAKRTQYVRTVHKTMPEIQSLRLMDNTSLFAYAAGVSLTIQRLIDTTQRSILQKPFKYKGPKPRYLPPIKYRKVKL